MQDTERELFSELRRKELWLKYKDFLPANYFSSPEARRMRAVFVRLHRDSTHEVLPLAWIKKAWGKNPELTDPLPQSVGSDYLLRTLLNSRTLQWQEWMAKEIEKGEELDLSPIRKDLLDYESKLGGAPSTNGAGPMLAWDIMRRKDWEKKPRTPTFLSREMDEYLGGGVGPGELCVLQAPPKNGKSSFLYTIAYRAAVEGLTSYIFSCENYEDQVGERLEQIHKASRRKVFPKNLYLDYRYTPCLADLEHLVRGLPRLDLLVVDYADNMRATRTEGPDFVWTIDELYDGIRHIAREKEAIAWTATQEKDPPQPWIRRSMRKLTYGSDKKIQKCDFFLGIKAHERDDTATLTVLGRRGRGKVGADFTVLFNQDTCEIRE
jgi:hypothetical protein